MLIPAMKIVRQSPNLKVIYLAIHINEQDLLPNIRQKSKASVLANLKKQ